MAEQKADVLVLGAGMVGVAAALHLQKRGRDVILVDKHERAGEETSYGNGGLIENASVFPYMFPRDLAEIVRYATNRAPQVRYAVAGLPDFLPWLVRYYLASAPDRALAGALAVMPLIRRSLIEHEALIAEAGVPELLRRSGWIKMFRGQATLADALRNFERARQYGVQGEILDDKALHEREPHLAGEFEGAIHLPSLDSSPIRAGWPRPMPRCSSARAGASWLPMRGPWNRTPAGDGRSRLRRARLERARRWWRSDRGPTW